jgi:hypothetical protein
MGRMGKVVNLTEWRRLRRTGGESPPASEPTRPARGRGSLHPRKLWSGSAIRVGEPRGRSGSDLERLESAIKRLHPFVSRVLDGEGKVEPYVETQLLAIMGELTMGLIDEATGRAERLTKRLAARRGRR